MWGAARAFYEVGNQKPRYGAALCAKTINIALASQEGQLGDVDDRQNLVLLGPEFRIGVGRCLRGFREARGRRGYLPARQ